MDNCKTSGRAGDARNLRVPEVAMGSAAQGAAEGTGTPRADEAGGSPVGVDRTAPPALEGRCSSQGSAGALSNETATASPWSGLPEEIVSRVLARLPVSQILRMRTVCKQWNAAASAPGFPELSDTLGPHESYFPIVLSRGFPFREGSVEPTPSPGGNRRGRGNLFGVFVGYDHGTRKWQRLPPLDFLPREARIPVAAAGGLVCFRGDSSLFLCNPVARTCTELPSIAHKWPPSVSVHVAVDNDRGAAAAGSYRVVLAGKIRHNFVTDSFRSVAVYESAAHAWRVVDAPPPPAVFSYGPTAAACGGLLYCEAICRGGELGVVAYDMGAEAWCDALHKVPHDDCGDYQLTQIVECGGAIYMVLGRGFGGVVTLVYVLKLEHAAAAAADAQGGGGGGGVHMEDSWTTVTTLPTTFLEDLRDVWFGEDDAAVVCVGHGACICIAAGTSLLLVYDVQLGSWSKVPSCSQVLGKSEDWANAEPVHFPIELRLRSLV